MYNIKRQISVCLQRTLLVSFLGIAFQFLSCMPEFDNPVSYNYQGDYQLKLTKPLSSNLEIFKPCTVSFENKGSDRYWRIYLSSNSDKPIFHTTLDTLKPLYTSISNTAFTIVFTDTISKGKFFLIAEQPNRTKTSYLISGNSPINVTNPYKIMGDTLAGIDDSVYLHIECNGSRISDSVDVEWKFTHNNNSVSYATTKCLSDSVSIKGIDDTIITEATLKFYNGNFSLPTHTINVKGHSPVIDSFHQNGALTFGTKASFSVKCQDEDMDSIQYVIIGDHNSHQDTLLYTIMHYDTTMLYFETDTIKDTSYSAIRLTITDANHLEDTKLLSNNQITYYRPVVQFNKNESAPPIGDSVKLSVTANSADKFYWRHGQKCDTTTTNLLTLPPYDTAVTDTIFVFGEKIIKFSDTTFHIFGDTDRIILTPRSYDYMVTAKIFTDTIKTKTPAIFQCGVMRGKDTVPEDSVTYKWKFSNTTDTMIGIPYQTVTANGSKVNIQFDDSIPPFIVTVEAVYLKDSSVDIHIFTRPVIVRSSGPFFQFNKPIQGKTALNYTIPYTANDISGTGEHLHKIYFRQISPTPTPFDSVDNGVPINMTFKTSGEITIEGYAVDKDGNTSKHATYTFNISITKPLFAQSVVTKSASTNKTVLLNAALVSSLPNVTFFWDKDNNGTWDTTTKVSQKSFTFYKEGTDTVRVQCKNEIGDSVTMAFYIVVKKNAPIIDLFRVKDSNYINKPDTFYVKGHDLDSNLKALYLFRFKSPTDSLLIDSIIYKVPRDTVDTLFTDSLPIAGTYLYSVHIKDTCKNTTVSEKKSVVIKQGLPTVKSVTPDSTFIYNSTELIIEPNDNDINNNSTFTYYISYDDTTHFNDIPSTGHFGKFSHPFNISGTNYFFIKVKDHDNQISLIHKDSIYVNLDAPTIKAITIDKDIIYINNTVKFTVQANDVQGTVDSVCADWNNDDSRDTTVVPSSGSKNSFLFSHSFPKDQAGERHIRFWAFDNNKIKSLIRDTAITIHKAPPVLDSIRSDSTRFWTKDNIPFSFFCNDTIGTIKRMLIDWGDGSKTDTSLNVITNKTTINAIHNYSIAKDSTYHRSVLLTDNDANESLFTDTVHILSGMPQVWIPGGGDTLFTRIANNGGPCTLTVASKDTNDRIVKYYWNINGTILDIAHSDSTITPSDSLNVGGSGFVNKVYGDTSAVFVRDADGNIASIKFFLYLDGPPPAPTIVYPISSTTIYSDQPVFFEWYGTDVHDGINTRYRISILPPVSNPTEKEIVKFIDNSGVTKELVNGIFHFKFQYNPTEGYGAYRWKVEAQDISNSTTSSQQQPFSFVQR